MIALAEARVVTVQPNDVLTVHPTCHVPPDSMASPSMLCYLLPLYMRIPVLSIPSVLLFFLYSFPVFSV